MYCDAYNRADFCRHLSKPPRRRHNDTDNLYEFDSKSRCSQDKGGGTHDLSQDVTPESNDSSQVRVTMESE